MRRWVAVVAACVVAVVICVAYLRVDSDNPPGTYRDESNIATNAAEIADSGRDEHGALLPVYFRSHGDWKSAPYIYLLAGTFAVAALLLRAPFIVVVALAAATAALLRLT